MVIFTFLRLGFGVMSGIYHMMQSTYLMTRYDKIMIHHTKQWRSYQNSLYKNQLLRSLLASFFPLADYEYWFGSFILKHSIYLFQSKGVL